VSRRSRGGGRLTRGRVAGQGTGGTAIADPGAMAQPYGVGSCWWAGLRIVRDLLAILVSLRDSQPSGLLQKSLK
jgi:hypothetical protein